MKKIIKPTIALVLICLACTAALTLINRLTDPRINSIKAQQQEEAMRELIPNASNFSDANEHEIQTDDRAIPIKFFSAYGENSEIIGYVFITSAAGYSGDISVMTAASIDASVIGVNILSISETPGLGMKVQEANFLEQFVSKIKGIAVSKNAAKDNEIQVITGATISARAITQAVNYALIAFEEFV